MTEIISDLGIEFPSIELTGRHSMFARSASVSLRPRPVSAEAGDSPWALVQWDVDITVNDVGTGGAYIPFFLGRGSHECDVKSLLSFASEIEALRLSSDMIISLGKPDRPFVLTLQMMDRRLGTILVKTMIRDPTVEWEESDQTYSICKDDTFPATLKIAFLTEQSALAVMRSNILALIRTLSNFKH